MRIANLECQGQRRAALSRDGDTWFELPAASLQQLLESGLWDVAASLAGRQVTGDFRLLAPFARPGQIIALARNYGAHAAESTLPVPHEPIFFSKANTSVIGPDEDILLPPQLGRIEPEIELAVVIKKDAWHVAAEAAAGYIAGYTILNDVSAQELQAREIREGYPLFRCKSLKTFTPLGPWIVTVDELGVSPALDMKLRINGQVRVTANTGGLTFGVAKLVEFISGYVALCAGDIITTGCPKAAGALQPGDLLELEIERIGVLRNRAVAG